MVNNLSDIKMGELKAELGFKGKNNPIAKVETLRPLFLKAFEDRDRQQFIGRYKWLNLPNGMDAEMMERILYYRGSLVAFKIADTYFTLPYALWGNIDLYGRYISVIPLIFSGSNIISEEDSKDYKKFKTHIFMDNLQLKVAYSPYDVAGKEGVILYDRPYNIAPYLEGRYSLNEPFRRFEADTLVALRLNMINSIGMYAIRVLDEGQKQQALTELYDMENAMLNDGKRFVVLTGSTTIDEFLKDKKFYGQEYWQNFVSADNLRENLMGIENNGVFRKKERTLVDEQELETTSADLIYHRGLVERKKFCETFNALFGENISCEESDEIMNVNKSFKTAHEETVKEEVE